MKIESIKDTALGSKLTDYLRLCGIKTLSEIQQMAIEKGVADGNSMIVCSPTSTGKTLVGEIALLASLNSARKSIYLVSHKALANQKYEDFNNRFGENSENPSGTVGLSTGDREEGPIGAQVLVSTYEKALGLILTDQFDTKNNLIVADEFQILGDPNRGPNIEILSSVILDRGFGQFVGLSATIENPHELSAWLNCELTVSKTRDIDLRQEIWYEGKSFRLTFGQEEGEHVPAKEPYPSDALAAVKRLINSGRGPILVFTETRREAMEFANEYSNTRARVADGIHIAEQLNLFAEPTESSEQLQANAERRVIFHTADLIPQERQIVEQGFIENNFDACFATSTLAAGVNFPFKTVLIPKLTYQWGEREGSKLPRSEYRNMSGRAGRLGIHNEGFSVLLPRNRVELQHANKLILPENDCIESQLVRLSMRRTVLTLISSKIIETIEQLRSFFKRTYYWHLTQEENPEKLEDIINFAKKSVEWLLANALIENRNEQIMTTPLGKAASHSGLLPSTVVNFVNTLNEHLKELEDNFDEYVGGLIHWICSCDEFLGDNPSRFLVWPMKGDTSPSTAYVSNLNLIKELDRANTQLIQCVHALILFLEGHLERSIRFETNISSGGLYRMALDVGWVLEGLHRIVCVRDLRYSQNLANRIAMLARRVRWGAPSEVLDVLRIAQKSNVPGFGRQRAMSLLKNGLVTPDDILACKGEQLTKILKSENRANALRSAISNIVSIEPSRFFSLHISIAGELGIERPVQDCYNTLGTDYEDSILHLLKTEKSWSVKKLDDGKRQNVPDILLEHSNVSILIECKTTTKQSGLVKKEDAFAILQKAVDFNKSMYRVTLGKPRFDENSKLKAQAATDITLIENSVFIEGLLRVLMKSISINDFIEWLIVPGLAEIERLGGRPTYSM